MNHTYHQHKTGTVVRDEYCGCALTTRVPVAAIPYEDAAEVARLADAFCDERWDHSPDSNECDPLTRSSMKNALREYANPTPPVVKPDEPTGLGAVVEDADGERWVIASGSGLFRQATGEGRRRFREYGDIAVVRVLSEGVGDR